MEDYKKYEFKGENFEFQNDKCEADYAKFMKEKEAGDDDVL